MQQLKGLNLQERKQKVFEDDYYKIEFVILSKIAYDKLRRWDLKQTMKNGILGLLGILYCVGVKAFG